MSRTPRLWLAVVPAALVMAGIVTAVVLTSDHQELPVLSVAVGGLTGLSFIVAGLIARTRRPVNRTGLLLMGVGFAWFAAGLTAASSSLVWTLGVTISAVFAALFVHLLLAYPSGQLGSRWERGVVVTGYVLAAVANVALLLFDRTPIESCEDCPSNAFLVAENETATTILTALVEGFAAVFLLGVVATLILRWRRSSSAARRALTPVLLAGALTLFFLGISVGTQEFWPTVAEVAGWIASVAFLTVPFLFLWGLLQSRLARAELGPLMRTGYSLTEFQRELRRLLRDPTAALTVCLEKPGGYIDAEGRPFELPEEGPERAVTEIADEDGVLGALVHDPALRGEDLLEDLAAALRLNLQRLRSTAALQASERRSRALLRALPDNMFRISRDGVYLDFHAQDPTQLRLPPERLIGSTVWDYPVPHQATAQLMATAEHAFETGSVQTFEFEAALDDGTVVHREGRITPSGPDEFLLVTRDITARKRAEQELRSSEQRSRALLEALPDSMFRLSREGTFLDYHASDATPLMDPETIVGANVYDYPVPRELLERIMAAAETAFKTGTRQTVEYELDDDNGLRYQEARITPSGEHEFFVIVRDVTDRKRSEQNLQISEQRSRALLEAIPDSMFRISCEGRILDYRVEPPIRLFRSEEDIIGSDIYDADFPREISERTMALGRKAVETGELQMHEYALEIDGRLHHQEARISPSGADEFLVIVRDITERKRQEQELRLSERRSRALVEVIPDTMFRISRDGTFLDYHSHRPPLRPVETIVGSSAFDYPVPRELIDRVMAAGEVALETGELQTLEWELELEGELRHQEGRITGSGEDEYFMIIRDVTERKQQEQKLQSERDFVAKVVNSAPTYFCVIHAEGKIVRYNDTLADATGRVDDETTRGRLFQDTFVLPGEVDEFERRLQIAHTEGDTGEFELRLRSGTGELLDVLWRGIDIYDETGESGYLLCGLDVTVRKRHEEEQAALRRVAVAVASERRTERIFDVVTEEVARLLGANTASLLRYEPNGEAAVTVGRWSQPGAYLDRIGERVPMVGGPVHTVYETRRPVRVDLEEGTLPPEAADRLRRMGVNSVVVAPITVSGRLWGAVGVSLAPPNAFPPGSEQRLGEFTRLVSLALANEEAREQLAASRARIVEAGDTERRRLERNLHDGAQQRLVSLSLSLRLAQSKLGSDPHAADELLSSASIELALALEELRELARGIHPAVLTERGLGPALESLADRSPLPVEFGQLPEERLPGQVEAAAYYVVSEALANVAKYAAATLVSVRVAQENGRAIVEVVDDGVGGADPARGSGLRGLTDRVEALEGQLAVVSEPGSGTRVRAEIPFA
jgi:PAS domain S-box-containing protein